MIMDLMRLAPSKSHPCGLLSTVYLGRSHSPVLTGIFASDAMRKKGRIHDDTDLTSAHEQWEPYEEIGTREKP